MKYANYIEQVSSDFIEKLRPESTFNFAEAIGGGYNNIWWENCHCRYRLLKGGRNTKKSVIFLGFEIIHKILSDSRRNVVVIRANSNSNKNTTVANLLAIINNPTFDKHPSVSFRDLFEFSKTDYTITRKSTGQVILFAGANNPDTIKSLKAKNGYITDIYIEEAFEITSLDAFRTIDGTLRLGDKDGKMPDGLFLQITMTFNAWSDKHWLYDLFFKDRLEDNYDFLVNNTHQEAYYPDLLIEGGFGRGVALHTSTYKINEFRDKTSYDDAMELTRQKAPRIYEVNALGMWGTSSETTYPEFTEDLIVPINKLLELRYAFFGIGIDTGLSSGEGVVDRRKIQERGFNSATTAQLIGISQDLTTLVALDEYFHSNEGLATPKSQMEIQNEIANTIEHWIYTLYYPHKDLLKKRVLVFVDSADLGFLDGLQKRLDSKGMRGLVTCVKSSKTKIITRVDYERFLMAWGNLLFSNRVPNLVREVKQARMDKKTARIRADFNDHCINAFEYAYIPFFRRMKYFENGEYKFH